MNNHLPIVISLLEKQEALLRDIANHPILQKLLETDQQILHCLSKLTEQGLPASPPTKTDEPEENVADVLFNRKAAAEYLLVDPRTVTRYRLEGKLRFIYNEAGKIRYRQKDLDDCFFWKWGKRP